MHRKTSLKRILCLAMGILFCFSTVGNAQQPVTLQSLLKEMVDRKALARFPAPYYETRQFSSHDRKATAPGNSTWFANWDRSQFIRTEQRNGHTEYVMMDAEGPGAIVRFWMTFAGEGAGQGTLRIYFDGAEEPAIEGTAFEVLSGGKLAGMPLSMAVSPRTRYEIRGHNLYLPLPYGRHCKITYQSEHIKDAGAKSGGESVYYNINYRTYEQGTPVQTFAMEQLRANDDLLRQVQERLLFRNKEHTLASLESQSTNLEKTIAPGQSYSSEFEGPGAIRCIALKLEAKNPEQALRSTIIQLGFDGRQTTWMPVGDFFGTGYRYRSSNTWYTTVTADREMRAYWVMPFRETATLTLKNLGEQEVRISRGEVTYTDWQWDHRSMYFGGSWQRYGELQTGSRKNMEGGGGAFDLNYVTLKGAGVYVGDVLTVFNTAYAWWGEGDEKIYIDGEAFPSHFGTGTEDYYGYAWVRPEVFTNHPFISQPDGSGNITPGYTVNMRFRALDGIPFRERLRVDMEMWHWVGTVINYSPATFYYLRPGGTSRVQPQPEQAKKAVALNRSDLVSPVVKDGRIEGEKMVIESHAGRLSYQHLNKPELSGGEHLWWRNAAKGDRLQAHFESRHSFTGSGTAGLVVAPDYGIADLFINGQRVLNNVDAFHPTVAVRRVKLENVKLKKSKNTVTIRLEGQNEASSNTYLGLDYLDFNMDK